ncbi:MAG: M28 family peptidase [Acidobacteriota bacterium]
MSQAPRTAPVTASPRGPARRPLRRLSAASALLALVAVCAAHAADTPSKTRAYVEMLASPRLEGRMTGSAGEQRSSAYLADELRKMGAKPLPGQADFLLPFEFTAGTRDGGTTLAVAGVDRPFTARQDVQALSFSDTGDVTAPVVFAGYGIVVPESQGLAYDSYAALDVKDKVVLVLRYFPEDADQKTRAVLARYADLRYKALAARQHGAKALLVVTGPRSPNAGDVVSMTFDTALAGSGIVAASISGNVGRALLAAGGGKSLDDVQRELDDANPHAAGFPLPGVTVTLHADVVRETRTGHNVVAYLPATVPPTGASAPDRPWVALGAHYDHLGHGEAGNTLASKDEATRAHPGADDNASGSAAVLAIGTALSTQPRHRNILLAFWSGEELGLLGSSAFVAHPALPLDQLAAYINFDMVGRMQDNKLTIQATGTSAAWSKIIEQANIPAGFNLLLQADPYQPTDVATFNNANVPCLTFFTGIHADYHRPTDTADKINYEDLDRIADFGAAIVRRLDASADAPAFTKVEQQTQPGGGHAGTRVFTGTIPDYSSDAAGLLLSGVVGGGPADQAGLQKGDVIVEIAGQRIANIYDYTYALDVLKIGQPAKVVYMRAGQRAETMLTPAARK